jgi:hypothetical protein
MGRMPGRPSKPTDNPELAELLDLLAGAGVPDDVLASVRDSASPEEAVERLVEMRVLPPPEGSFVSLLDHWTPLLRRGCSQLEAELAGSVFVGMVEATATDPAEVPDLLAGMIEQAGTHGEPEALAMLRSLAVVGPVELRAAADEKARRLAAGGLKDRPWVNGLGAPVVGACCGYADKVGAQQALAVAFSYGRQRHGLVILIDHDLGGGVKDCWVTDEPDTVREEYRSIAAAEQLEFRDYEPAEAGAVLTRALSEPPCPQQPDQIDSVRDTLALLRQRAELLRAGPTARTPAPRKRTPAPRKRTIVGTVHRLKVTLRDSEPPIWRRVEVQSNITLGRLHAILQIAFGWENSHLWVFETPAGEYGIPDPDLEYLDAAKVRLADVAGQAGVELVYTYDFGDGWDHDILVEDVGEPEPRVRYPRCVDGRRAGPPEDSGGIYGYANLLEILADPGHREHALMLEWLGLESAGEFDPDEFDRDEVNDAFATMRGRVRG